MKKEELLRWFLQELCECIERLSASAQEQIDYLHKISAQMPPEDISVDELALEFDDAWRAVPQLVREGKLTQQQAEAIDALDQKLNAISGSHNAELWMPDALQNSPHWVEIRRLALIAREAIGC